MTTAFITHPLCLEHSNGPFNPENAERIKVIEDELINSGLISCMQYYESQEASREQLIRVHTSQLIDRIEANIPADDVVAIGNEVCLSPLSFKAALRAAGAVVSAVDLVMSKEVDNAFCCVRPPGHHATKDTSMGFCIFNNVAVGVAHVLEKYGLERVAILDFDAHHGNGTEDIFKNDRRVLFCSTFQHPFYPGSGASTKAKNVVNVPLNLGEGSEEFRNAVKKYWMPALKRFKPQMVFVSAGFDAHRNDTMANLNLKRSDFAWITKTIKEFAVKQCDGRVISVLEGGYHLKSLVGSALAHIKVLVGSDNYELVLPYSWKSPEGIKLTVRELTPFDTQRLADFVKNLSFQARYYRFGDGNFTPDKDGLTEICTPKKGALIHLVITMTHDGEETIIGSSRCIINHKKNDCEFSLAVADNWHKQGIALRLIESLIRLLKPMGIHKIHAKVLDTNSNMMHFVKQAGFKLRDSSKQKWMKVATLTLK